MLKLARPALSLILLFTALLGLAYPLAITGVAGALMPRQAGGSLVLLDGRPVGSSLIGQAFTSPRYFHGRPSATAETPYNAAASGGSNLGPTSAKLRDAIAAEVARLGGPAGGPLPADAVTASGSGLDPDISPAYARLQIARVAQQRRLPEDRIARLVALNTEAPLFGLVGESRVNVLHLNMALDKMSAEN